MTPPSRGSALYAATLVTIGAAAGVRFFTTTADAAPVAPAGAAPAPASATAPASPTATPSDQGTALTWGRGSTSSPVPTPTATPTPTPSATPVVPTPRPAPTASHVATPTAAPKPAAPAPAPAAPAAPVTKVVVGSTVQTRYGPVQVSVTFTGGTIVAVQALQSPSGGYSSQVSSFSLPTLAQEAVAANSANIASVSGATFTSAGYQQSLQYAIDHKG